MYFKQRGHACDPNLQVPLPPLVALMGKGTTNTRILSLYNTTYIRNTVSREGWKKLLCMTASSPPLPSPLLPPVFFGEYPLTLTRPFPCLTLYTVQRS